MRRGLREAIGQLIDYSIWEKQIKVKKISAVLPYSQLSESAKQYIRRAKKVLNLDLEVLLYDKESNVFLNALSN
ncbi:hypothetical protein D3C78_1794490 [compost metagenome]